MLFSDQSEAQRKGHKGHNTDFSKASILKKSKQPKPFSPKTWTKQVLQDMLGQPDQRMNGFYKSCAKKKKAGKKGRDQCLPWSVCYVPASTGVCMSTIALRH